MNPLRAWLNTNGARVFEDKSKLLVYNSFAGFSRRNGYAAKDPVVSLGMVRYDTPASAKAAAGSWKNLTNSMEEQGPQGALSYRVMTTPKQEDVIRTVEIYDTAKSKNGVVTSKNFTTHHSKDMEQGRKWSTELELKVTGGFFGRDAPAKSRL